MLEFSWKSRKLKKKRSADIHLLYANYVENVNVGFSEAGPDNLHNPLQGCTVLYWFTFRYNYLFEEQRDWNCFCVRLRKNSFYHFSRSVCIIFLVYEYFGGEQSKRCSFDHTISVSGRIIFLFFKYSIENQSVCLV